MPFKLDESKLDYSLYYTGKLTKDKTPLLDSYKKTKKQQEIELRDMKEHGVLYPTSYEKIDKLEETLKLRDKVGLPRDRFYTIGFNVMSSGLSKKILKYKKILNQYSYDKDALYIYAIDEASEDKLKKELPFIKIAHDHSAKVFTAGYQYTYDYLGNYLDLFNYAHGSIRKDAKEQVKKWHKSKKEIFVYASPQVGVENPEVYRRNFGCKLWKKGFDGAMNWAYQAHRGAFWNDFDKDSTTPNQFREEAFTYPTTDGIIGTIQWEGFREAITDVRYISTLENLRNMLEVAGKDVYHLNLFIKNIDCDSNLDKLREKIIDNILKYRYVI